MTRKPAPPSEPSLSDHSPLTTHHSPARVVIKLGGSLLDVPDLPVRLGNRLRALPNGRVLLIIGGGVVADQVRRRDHFSRLGDEKAHWLAVRAMSFNSYLVEALLPHATVVGNIPLCQMAWKAGRIPILDPHPFLLDHQASDWPALPHTWAVTSDTIAARVARVASAHELILLKSVSWPDSSNLLEAARRGIVDQQFPQEAAMSPQLMVRIENIRSSV